MPRVPSIRTAFAALMVLVLALAPTQWSLHLVGGLRLTPGDLLLLVAVPAGLLAGARPWRLPATHLLFLGLTALSVGWAADRGAAVKEWVQLALYFGAGTMLAEAAWRQFGRRGLAWAVWIFLGTGAVIVGLAMVQYWLAPVDDPLAVRGSFGNRNVLGGYLALLLPAAFGLLLDARRVRERLLLGLLVLAGLFDCLSGPAWLAIALALMALATLRGPAWFVGTGLVLLAVFTLLLPRMPRGNDYEAFTSMALYDEAGQPARRYPEWQAAAVMALERPWTGQGLGGYQKQIGMFYGVVPNATGPAEPDIQNLYLVLAATAGLPACFAFLAMLLEAGAAACRGRRAASSAADAPARFPGLEPGLAAGLAAFALTALWHPLLVRGIGLPLALLLAATRCRTLNEPAPA